MWLGGSLDLPHSYWEVGDGREWNVALGDSLDLRFRLACFGEFTGDGNALRLAHPGLNVAEPKHGSQAVHFINPEGVVMRAFALPSAESVMYGGVDAVVQQRIEGEAFAEPFFGNAPGTRSAALLRSCVRADRSAEA